MQNKRNHARMLVTFLAVVTSLALEPAPSASAQDRSLLGNDLSLGRCKESQQFALALHGGTAKRPNTYESGVDFIARLLEDAGPALAAGATSVDLVHGAVRAMEDSGLFNAGRGARANKAGVVEMDAAIMDGRRRNAGAVASVKTVKNPITAARLVMRRSPQVMLVGPDAEAYVAKNRGTIVRSNYFRLSGLNFDDIPLPKNIEITSPDSSLPPRLAGFSGIWGGVFDGAITVLLAVEEVTATGARVVFGHGINPDWDLHVGHAARYDAELFNGTLEISIDHPAKGRIKFRIGSDTRLEAVYNARNARRMTASLKRFTRVPRPE